MMGEGDSQGPRTFAILWRMLGLLLLALLWLQDQGDKLGVVLLLFLSIMALARWRFELPSWTVLFDQAACFILMPFWPNAAYGLAISLFEINLNGTIYFAAPIAIFLLFGSQMSLPLTAVYLQSIFSGRIIRGWHREKGLYQQEADWQRKDRYELESLKGDLLVANVQAARNAELAERNRIAQDLHDDVGHEITAAVLALQAFEQLWREADPQAKDMFNKAQQRLNNSALQLREAVYNMKPNVTIGIERLKEICDGFTACPISLEIYGDTLEVPAYLWGILEPCLKEALTNVIRHSKATGVDVKLDVTPNIVRLGIHNDGVINKDIGGGVGLRNLRLRARAIGGSIAVAAKEDFHLICVLPIGKGMGGNLK